MIFENDNPGFLLEYDKNELFVTNGTHMCLVHDWQTVKLITEPNPANIMKTYAFTVPDFNKELNPFIVVLGEASLNILNVKTKEHKPLIKQKMQTGLAGLQGAFIKKEKTGFSVHFAYVV